MQGIAIEQHLRQPRGTVPDSGLSTKYHCGSAKTEQLNREFTMSLKKASVAAAIAVSMASTPVLAQSAQTSAAPLSVAASSGAQASGEGSQLRGGFIIPLVAIIAIILGILAATQGGNDRPSSP
jgi:hypothetical protein